MNESSISGVKTQQNGAPQGLGLPTQWLARAAAGGRGGGGGAGKDSML